MGWLTFEGVIPDGMYGAGEVTVYDTGKYQTVEKNKSRWVVKLFGKKVTGVYELRLNTTGSYKGKWNIRKLKTS